MSRSPLFAKLSRALRLADAAEQRGMSTSELLERRHEAQSLSRRRALGGAGAMLGVAALGGLGGTTAACASPSGGIAPDEEGSSASALQKGARIVVVGAGLAGLTAAYRLAQRGFNPVVYDANGRVGGRAFSLRGAFATKIEMGGELIDTGHVAIQGLAQELGLTLLDQASASAGYEAERYFIGQVRYTEADMIELYRPIAKLLRADFQAQAPTKYATYTDFTPASRAFDRLSIEAWLDQKGVTGALRGLLDVAYTAEYGREIAEQSYLNLLYLIGKRPDPFLLFGESDEKYTIQEGNDAITTALAAGVSQPVRLEHRLTAVKAKADGTLRVTFEHAGRAVEVIADKLVLALPFNQLRKCALDLTLSRAKRLAIQTVPYGTNAKLMVGTTSRPWNTAGAAGTSFNDRVYHESWESSRGYPVPGGVMTAFNGGRFGVELGAGTAQHQANRFLGELDKVFPGTRAAYSGHAVRMHWPTARHFEGSYGCWAPGNYTTFVGSEAEIEGNVHFCGEHTSTDFQGFLEGAVETGERVAKEIRQALRGPA